MKKNSYYKECCLVLVFSYGYQEYLCKTLQIGCVNFIGRHRKLFRWILVTRWRTRSDDAVIEKVPWLMTHSPPHISQNDGSVAILASKRSKQRYRIKILWNLCTYCLTESLSHIVPIKLTEFLHRVSILGGMKCFFKCRVVCTWNS